MAIAAAWHDERRLLTAPLLLISLALTGRVVTAALLGLSPPMVQPMAIEAVLILVLAVGRCLLGGRAR